MKDMAKTEQKTGWKHILEETEARHEWGKKTTSKYFFMLNF